MENSNYFDKFARGKKELTHALNSKACVIYTRVSTKEQAENNQSLETQLKWCNDFAKKKSIPVLEYFGGTYESAQTDERKEFQRMINFTKKYKDKISSIVVYSLDRFSRTGDNAIWLSRELRQLGIMISSVTQPMDTSNPSGVFQQNMILLFGQFDNDQRREKSVAGSREKLLKGEWVTKAPIGYDHVLRSGQKLIVVNEIGKLIRMAFEWKANEGISNADILLRLSEKGLNLSKQHISEILKNPFYAGMLSHKLLDGKIIEGKHEKLITPEIFRKVNEIQSKYFHGFTWNKDNQKLPLKLFYKCDKCRTALRGYIVRAKGLHYYKCNTIGCGCNIRATVLEGQFEQELRKYSIPQEYVEMLKYQLTATFNQLIDDKEERDKNLSKRISEQKQKIEKVQERFALDLISQEIYLKVSAKLKEELDSMENENGGIGIQKSNLELFIEKALSLSANLNEIWHSAGYDGKQKLQYLVFPEGLSYSKQNNESRTIKVNSFFNAISTISSECGLKNKGPSKINLTKSCLVAGTGLEPMTFGL